MVFSSKINNTILLLKEHMSIDNKILFDAIVIKYKLLMEITQYKMIGLMLLPNYFFIS